MPNNVPLPLLPLERGLIRQAPASEAKHLRGPGREEVRSYPAKFDIGAVVFAIQAGTAQNGRLCPLRPLMGGAFGVLVVPPTEGTALCI